MIKYLSIIFFGVVFIACSSSADKSEAANQEVYVQEELDVIIDEESVLENIIKSKLQEAIDLQTLLKDTTLPQEMRNEIEADLKKIDFKETIEGSLKQVSIVSQDSNNITVGFVVDTVIQSALVKINKEEKFIKGKEMKTIEVELIEIK